MVRCRWQKDECEVRIGGGTKAAQATSARSVVRACCDGGVGRRVYGPGSANNINTECGASVLRWVDVETVPSPLNVQCVYDAYSRF